MKVFSRLAILSTLGLVLAGCTGSGWNVPAIGNIGGIDPNARLSGTLYYEKTEKHPKYGSQDKAIADGSCNLSFTLSNYSTDDRVRCGSFLIHVTGSVDSSGEIRSLKLKTLGTIYDMKGSVSSSTGLEPRNGFWRAILKLKTA